MNRTRIKWSVLMLLFFAAVYLGSHYRVYSVRESLNSAQLYWHGEDAVVTLTTTAEVRSESLEAHLLRLAVERLRPGAFPPSLRVGAAHVFAGKNGSWQELKLDPMQSPRAFPLWPFNGRFYSWDERNIVRSWNGHQLTAVPPALAAQLHSAFPADPNNFFAAGQGASPKPYDVIQDAITRDEWHSYSRLQSLAAGKQLSFPLGSRNLTVSAQRSPSGEPGLVITGGAAPLTLWTVQAASHSVNAAEYARYLQPFGPFQRPSLNMLWLELAASVLALAILWMIFLKPTLSTVNPSSIAFEDADAAAYPKLDRARWSELSAQIEALGFERVRDVKMAGSMLGGIARVLLHPKTNCYASIHQVFSSKAPPLSYGFTSYLAEGWSVGHGVTLPIPGNVLTRIPRKLAFCCPGMDPEQLYAKHIEQRDRVAAQLGVAVEQANGFDSYLERSNQDARDRAEKMRKTNTFAILAMFQWAKLRGVPLVWLGDYPKEVEARTGVKPVPGEL